MGKTKQQSKEKKFDRNVEISAPILDPEIIKAIHSPPKGQKVDLKHGGFKALLTDLNSQDSTDELTPITDNHVPSYIGISCAVSGYSGYSPYSRRNIDDGSESLRGTSLPRGSTLTHGSSQRSRALSPISRKIEPRVNHVTIDKSQALTIDQERKELTEKLTASATERIRSPSPNCIPQTEDDRHHGAYVGARYCPLPAPDKVVNKHIPLLGIDDEEDPDKLAESEKENKVEQRIASLYGEEYAENWRESNKREPPNSQQVTQEGSPKPVTTVNGHYYLDQLEKEKDIILEQVKCANGILERREAELDEDTIGNLRSAIGKANLLVDKKFDQFRGLCQANINAQAGEQFATLNEDLDGFWDLLAIQVKEIRGSFEKTLALL